MRIQITAGGIFGADGELPIGTRLDVAERPVGWDGRFIVLGEDGENAELVTGEGGDGEGEGQGKTDGGDYVPVGPFAAEDTGGHWWTIFDANKKQVGKKMRKADAEAFNGLSDDDKAEFLKGEA